MWPKTRLELLLPLMWCYRATTKFWGRESSWSSLSSWRPSSASEELRRFRVLAGVFVGVAWSHAFVLKNDIILYVYLAGKAECMAVLQWLPIFLRTKPKLLSMAFKDLRTLRLVPRSQLMISPPHLRNVPLRPHSFSFFKYTTLILSGHRPCWTSAWIPSLLLNQSPTHSLP